LLVIFTQEKVMRLIKQSKILRKDKKVFFG
jgi:hypothetical protein